MTGRTQLAIGLLAAVAAGVLAALAQPPHGWLIGLLGYPLLLALLDRLDRFHWGKAFLFGWATGFAYFLIGCAWVANAFLVDAENQAWMAPFAVILLPAGVALFWGAAAALWRRFCPEGLRRTLAFAVLLSVFEWLRGHALTGFPWTPVGATWSPGGGLSQSAAAVGVWGLGFLTLAGLLPLALLAAPGPRKPRIVAALTGVGFLLVLSIGGEIRLAYAANRALGPVVRIVQPDVDQKSKWSEAAFADIVRRYVNLTGRAGPLYPDVILWPEGALPASAGDILATRSWVRQAIEGALQPDQVLIFGAYREQRDERGRSIYYNSVIALRRDAAGLSQVGLYDKHRLVPFGEYLPMEEALTAIGFKDLTHVGDGFSPGPRPRPISLPGLGRVQPLICYEDLYAGLPRGGGTRPDWMFTVSNDAWFGRGSGPRQHASLAAYRAIEQGLAMVRSTPTGVSAVYDPWGRGLKGSTISVGESGAVDVRIPRAAIQTPYARIGDFGFLLLVCLGMAYCFGAPPPRSRPAEA